MISSFLLVYTQGSSISAWADVVGRLHVAAVHFPITLLVVAGLVELWRMIRHEHGLSHLTATCLVLGGLSALPAMATGLVHEEYFEATGQAGEILETHEVLGITTACVSGAAMLVLLLAHRLRRPWLLWGYRILVIGCAPLVAVTGHLGGQLTHGAGYLTEPMGLTPRPAQTLKMTGSQGGSDITAVPAAQAREVPVVSMKAVRKILDDACHDCHGQEKQRGGLRVDSREGLLKGGKNGPAIIPGNAEQSLLIKRTLGLGGKARMPKGEDPLPAAQVQVLKDWIDGGAR